MWLLLRAAYPALAAVALSVWARCFRLHSISNYLHIFCLGALPRQATATTTAPTRMRAMRTKQQGTTKQNTNIIFTSFNLMRSKRSAYKK